MRQRFRSLIAGMVLSAAFCGSAMTPEPRRALEMPAEANSASTPEQLREREKAQIAGLKYADNRTVFSDTGCYIRYNAMGGTFAFADLAVAHRDGCRRTALDWAARGCEIPQAAEAQLLARNRKTPHAAAGGGNPPPPPAASLSLLHN